MWRECISDGERSRRTLQNIVADSTGGQPTDIPGDFIIDLEGDFVDPVGAIAMVLEGATHVFVGAGDILWWDNTLTAMDEHETLCWCPSGPATELGKAQMGNVR